MYQLAQNYFVKVYNVHIYTHSPYDFFVPFYSIEIFFCACCEQHFIRYHFIHLTNLHDLIFK